MWIDKGTELHWWADAAHGNMFRCSDLLRIEDKARCGKHRTTFGGGDTTHENVFRCSYLESKTEPSVAEAHCKPGL